MKTKPLVKEFIRFGVVGVLATALHYGIYYFLQSFINVNVLYDGICNQFYCQPLSDFLFYVRNHFRHWKSCWYGRGRSLVNYLLHIILLNVFLYLGVSKAWAPVPVFAIAIPVNFLFVRFVFKHKKL